MTYSGGDENLLRDFLRDFLDSKPTQQERITSAFAAKNWHDYTTFVHALKSSSLAVGGKKLSAAAKQQEQAGKNYEGATDEEAKANALSYINSHHDELMSFYDEFAAQAGNWLTKN